MHNARGGLSKPHHFIIAESANLHNTGSGTDDAAQGTSLAAVAAQSPADHSKLISKVLEEQLVQFGKSSGASGSKGEYRKISRNSSPKERKGSPTRKSDVTAPSLRLASAKNKDNQPGSKTYAHCWRCS